MRKTLGVLVAAFAALLVPSEILAMHAGKSHVYAVIIIDTLPGDAENGATAVNASGTVAGWSGAWGDAGSVGTAFRWTPATLDWQNSHFGDGNLQALDALRGFSHSHAHAINSAGHVVGYNWASDQSRRMPVLWTGTGPAWLGSLPDAPWLEARGINDAGEIVGGPAPFLPAGSVQPAFRWTPTVPNGTTGTMTDLGSPLGGDWAGATAINTNGVIVGGAEAPGSPDHAVRWDAGVPTDLGAGVGGPYPFSGALGINASRLAVGVADEGDGPEGAVWTARLDLTLLGTLPLTGYKWSTAQGVNGPGRAVGWAGGTNTHPLYLGFASRAFRWHKATGLEDLNDVATIPSWPPTILVSAFGINDDGVIVGEAHVGGIDLGGVLFTAPRRAFIAVPTITIGVVHGDPYRRDEVAVSRVPYFKVCDPLRVCEQATLTNVTRQTLEGPFHVAVKGLTRGQRMANADGTYHEAPFVTVQVPRLRPNQSATVILEFDRTRDGRPPAHEVIVYSGAF